MDKLKDLEALSLGLNVNQAFAEQMVKALKQHLPNAPANAGMQALSDAFKLLPPDIGEANRFPHFLKHFEEISKLLAVKPVVLTTQSVSSSYPVVMEIDTSSLLRLIRNEPKPRTPIGFKQNNT